MEDLSEQPHTILCERVSAVVDNRPHAKEDLKRFFWMVNATEVLIYNYETRLKMICPIQTHVPRNQISHGFLNMGSNPPETLLFTICIGKLQVYEQDENHCDPLHKGARKSYSRLVWIASYRVEDLHESNFAQALTTGILELQDIHDSAIPTVTMGRKCAYVTAMLPNNDTECPRIFYTATDFPRYMDILAKQFQPWVGLPSIRITYPDQGQTAIIPTSSFNIPSVTSIHYFPGVNDSDSGRLVALVSSHDFLLASKMDMGADILFEDKSSADDTPNLIENEDRSSVCDRNQNLSKINHPRVSEGALCELCRRIVESSALLNLPKFWRETSLSDVDDGFEVGQEAVGQQIHRNFASLRLGFSDEEQGDASTSTDYPSLALNDSEPQEIECSASAPQYENYVHHNSLQDLALSVLHGCHLCSLFQSRLEKEVKEAVDELITEATKDIFGLGTSSPTSNHFHTYKKLDMAKTQNITTEKYLNLPSEQVWMQSRADKIVTKDAEPLCIRIRSNSCNKDEHGQLTLYKPSSKSEPTWKAGVKIVKLAETASEANRRLRYSRDHEHNDECCAHTTSCTSSKATFVLAKSWMSECLKVHGCSTVNPQSPPPTRVIDVSPAAGTGDLQLRLTKPSDRGLPYVTLSHCWGLVKPLELTTANISQLTQGFAMADLPETFRDAILICRGLDQKYLWIDSLCILQDDIDDWKKEAALMADVYGNSLCPIAAQSSRSVRSGCFAVRQYLQHAPLVFESPGGLAFFADSSNQEPPNLNTRGWVFQERLLSPRTLGFSSTGITWECRRKKANERWLFAIPPSHITAVEVDFKKMLVQASTPLSRPLMTGKERRMFLSAWFELIEEYATLDLTRQGDKLIAMAGVAAAISKGTGFNYYYGLWHDVHASEMLLSQLLWSAQRPHSRYIIHKHGGETESLVRDRNQAPSFSWAVFAGRIDHRITFHDRQVNSAATTYDIRRSTFMLFPKKIEGGDAPVYCQLLISGGKLDVCGKTGDPFTRTDVVFPTQLV
ncbi:hypothetical protein HJFPF1_08251 [Paramyrothecium foliicola]|nr:hypothetical protein HJFPF1_08251 [Paramyrothecium foliicola]